MHAYRGRETATITVMDYGGGRVGTNNVPTLLSHFGTAYTYTPNSNRLDAIGSADVLLDNNGNTLNKGTWTFDYNTHNRLTAAYANSTLAATYAYNGLGQRIGKTKPDTTGRHFLYGTQGELLAETDTDGNLLNEYIYLNGQPLAVYQPDADSDGLSNAEEDPIGSNPANSDSDGDGLTNLAEWYTTGTDARVADSDGDGVLDGAEVSAGTDPNNATIYPGDGDVNQDGQVDAGDLLLVMQMATGRRVPTAEQLIHADMHTDGVIDVRDMLKLQRRVLGYSLWEWFNALPGAEKMLAIMEHALDTVAQAIDADLIRKAEAAVANGKLFYIHTDHLGTPKALTNEAGTKVWSATHDPFGMATVNEDANGNGSLVTFNLRYAGQYADEETGLHYNYFRTYDPGTGRYLESDPIGLEGGLNTYGYVEGNPLNYTDPTGELPQAIIGALTGASIDIAVQLIVNGGRFECIKWSTVAIAAGLGAVNPFSVGNALAKADKANRQLARSYAARSGSRAASRIGWRADKNRNSAWKELASYFAVEGAAEGVGSLVPDKCNCNE